MDNRVNRYSVHGIGVDMVGKMNDKRYKGPEHIIRSSKLRDEPPLFVDMTPNTYLSTEYHGHEDALLEALRIFHPERMPPEP